MKYFIIFLTLIFEVHEYSSLSVNKKPPLGIIQSHGYPAEKHSVFTEDDYELILHRIPYGTNCKKENGTRTPVIVQHGVYEGSQIWLFLGPDNALGFLLADNCYDVWLGNSRGNCASRGHKYLNTSQPKYWDFSYHEMGVYDLKAVVDYIVDVTKQDEVLYIGYSQGSTVGLVNAINYPDNKIKAYFLLAPIAYFTYNPSILRALYPFEPLLTVLTQHVTGNFELRFNIEPLKIIEKIICSVVPEFCYIPLFMCGVDPLHVNRTALPDQLLESCGISTKQLFHYLQGYYLELSQFNYDPLTNIKKYGSKRPPAYDVNKINKPVYVYHSPSDLCGDLKDIEKLKEKLGDNLVKIHLVENPSFDHLGFAFNNNVKELVYDTLISDMLKVLS